MHDDCSLLRITFLRMGQSVGSDGPVCPSTWPDWGGKYTLSLQRHRHRAKDPPTYTATFARPVEHSMIYINQLLVAYDQRQVRRMDEGDQNIPLNARASRGVVLCQLCAGYSVV